MLWFVSNVGNVSNDGRLPGRLIGTKSDRGAGSVIRSLHINLIDCLGRVGYEVFIQKTVCHLHEKQYVHTQMYENRKSI